MKRRSYTQYEPGQEISGFHERVITLEIRLGLVAEPAQHRSCCVLDLELGAQFPQPGLFAIVWLAKLTLCDLGKSTVVAARSLILQSSHGSFSGLLVPLHCCSHARHLQPQNEHIELHRKRHGYRYDFFERTYVQAACR